MTTTLTPEPSPFLCLACGEESIIAGPWPQRECVECGAVYSTLEAAGWWQPDVPANPEASGTLWQAGTGDSAARSRATSGRRADRSGAAWVQRARAGTRETLLGVVCDVRC